MILYEDKEILVCHKPAGIPVQSASVRQKDMVSILKNHIVSEHTGTGDIYVVHRLDQPVEGVLVFAKTKQAAANLSSQITDGSMKKIYHAVVSPYAKRIEMGDTTCRRAERGGASTVSPCAKRIEMGEWYTLVDYLVKDGRKNLSFVSDAENKTAKRAELRFRILKKQAFQGFINQTFTDNTDGSISASALTQERALVEIELKTGRHHQIRVQMAHAGMPLVGDRKYGSSPEKFTDLNIPDSKAPDSLALCAVSLTFRHPETGKTMNFEVASQNRNLKEFSSEIAV